MFLPICKLLGPFSAFVVVNGTEFLHRAKVGVVEFLNGVEKWVETHAAKVEEAVDGELQRLLETRMLRRKKFGGPCMFVRLLPVSVFSDIPLIKFRRRLDMISFDHFGELTVSYY